MIRKRIGVLVGQPDEVYQKNFLEGFLSQTFANDYDVCVFAMYKKYQGSTNREIGESAIFTLIPYEEFDGFVVLADTIQTTGVLAKIDEELHEKFTGPVVFVDKESKYFPSINTDHYEPAKKLIAHLIEEHGMTKIAYLTGKSWHPHSIVRLQAYKDSMQEHGLSVREDWIFEGDFWYTSGESMVEKLLRNPDDLPEAIACANDCMAIGAANAFEKNGYRIPEDIAIIGYDSSDEGKNSSKPMTSAPIPSKECGAHAASCLHALMCGEEIPEFHYDVELFIGSTCGCEATKKEGANASSNWEMTINARETWSEINLMMDDLMCQKKITDLLNVIFSYTYQIPGFDSFHLCLNEQWGSIYKLYDPNQDWENYSDKMVHAIDCRASIDNPGRVGTDIVFDKKDLLPELNENRDVPRVFYFTPMFFDDVNLGYASIGFANRPDCYDEVYCTWLANVMRGLESFRRLAYANEKEGELQRLRENLAKTVHPVLDSDGNVVEDPNLSKNLSKEEKVEKELVTKILNENLFTYHFQPIVDARTGEIYSYEALMRSNTEQRISPLSILKHAEEMGRLYDVEKYTFFNILQFVSDNKQLFENKKIFINSIPGVSLSEEELEKVAKLVESNRGQIVVELTEQAELQDDELASLKERYAQMGVKTAVDDYGTGYSNISNLLRYMPKYVKIDRSLLTDIQHSPQKQQFVKQIIEFSHENDIVVLAEGIETSDELQTVILLGADLIQGYYTAKPNEVVIQSVDTAIKREIHLCAKQLLRDKSKRVYTAGKEFRISMAKLVSDECEYIIVPNEETTYRDFSIIGVPGLSTNISIQIADGYKGRIVLNNVCLGGKRGVPCIDIGEDCDLTLDIHGDNELKTGGIHVPENAKLTMDGDGTLSIRCNFGGAYAIGNDMDKRHGDLVFDQDGTIEVDLNGKESVAIGSGLGGNILINRGKFVMNMTGNTGVALGCLKGSTNIRMTASDWTISSSLYEGVGIGSIQGKVNCFIQHISFYQQLNGSNFVGIGSVYGETADMVVESCNLRMKIRGEKVAGVGSLTNKTALDISYASLVLDAESDEIVVIGDMNNQSTLKIAHCEVQANLLTDYKNIMGIDMDKFDRGSGRFIIRRNREPVEEWTDLQ